VIRVFDASGALVSSFSSADQPKPLDLSTLAVAPEWAVLPTPPSATAGQHRFVWNLHFPPPPAFKDDKAFTGLWAPPGRYTVELDVDGQALRQPLEIRPDPRISVSQAEFDAQFRLARQLEQQRVRAHSMLKDASALKDRLKADKAPTAQALLAQIDAIVGTPPPPDGSNDVSTLMGISDRLDTLATAVESADGAPTPDNLRGYATLSAALNAAEQRWNAFAAAIGQH
jgi:hypothetical protein